MTSPNKNVTISELIDLTGKRAIITGGAMGIGFAICRRLAEAGATVFVADTNAEAAQGATEQLKGCGYNATFTQCDVSQEEEVKAMVNTAIEKMGGIDILVNNAGIYPRISLSQMFGNDFEQVISVNLTGTFLCSRYTSQKMIEQRRGGCIINIASIDSLHPSSTGLSAYDSSKGGVLMLTKSLALELGQYNIRVNAIAPGGIMTKGVLSQARASSKEQEKAQLKELKAFMARMVLGRMGDADDVARVALFLVSDLASYVTGDLIVVDGGYLIS
ncbi:MAG TPA: SDR family oxidoreductase [Dehalococcoidia bacterium]|nr:SDR family oxidoreductase [Dehalococcoidia bacterium]